VVVEDEPLDPGLRFNQRLTPGRKGILGMVGKELEADAHETFVLICRLPNVCEPLDCVQ
jgi:hypothetical protein